MHAPQRLTYWLGILALAIVFAGCDSEAASEDHLFEPLAGERTGVTFVNELPEDTDINILNYLYYYNGGGLAVGDVSGNGLPDLYFTSNLGKNRLYLNHGDFEFEDVTDQAGVAGSDGWSSGATMADVNGNGLVDIYVSAVQHLDLEGRNILYINNGDGSFSDKTAEYGLEHEGYSTQAAFFDFTGNGYLDMYLLNHAVHTERSFRDISQRDERDPKAGDRLFRNEGGTFTDVSEELGIYGGSAGYGLGIAVSDFNRNGCLDIYIGNDFHENDFFYRNNCDGTFSESIDEAMRYTSYFSMGVDAADFTNNGLPDLAVLDMQPQREDILKTSVMAERYDTYRFKLGLGYHPQYYRNTLQLNRGEGRFSEIGYLAGVNATDWSWSALFADLDNSGRKDLFVSNGIYRRPNDLDYISYISNEAIQSSLEQGITEENLDLLDQMPHIPIPNVAFRNNGDLTFSESTDEWGLHQPGFSNGTAYVDLNNDGALDLVINNINDEASIYRNRSREKNGHHFLKVELEGEAPNTLGIGAKVTAFHDGEQQMVEQMPTRGFQSSVDHRLHFGLGTTNQVDSLQVIWPDGRTEMKRDLSANTTIRLVQEGVKDRYEYGSGEDREGMFADVSNEWAPDFSHEENTFTDFNREPFLTHKLSREGPALAVGDVTGNGLDDMYVGGARDQSGHLYLQQPGGEFELADLTPFESDVFREDTDAIFFDANGNGHLDLYVVSAGNEFWGDHEALRDRLYINGGAGVYQKDESALPDVFSNGAVVISGDFTGNGAPDLFVGGRVVAREYGKAPDSFLLANDGAGKFTDVTDDWAPFLRDLGMVTDAAWIDYTGNDLLDLVVVGEWMPVTVFAQTEQGSFKDRTQAAGFDGTDGWWYAVETADLNGNGLNDLVLGNHGLNSYIKTSPEQPARLYMHDFEGDGRLDQLLTFYRPDGESYPIYGRNTFVENMPSLRSKYPTHHDFADSRLEDIFSSSDLREAEIKEAFQFESAIALNQGDGTFKLEKLPVEAQFSPVRSILIDDFDGSGKLDLLLAGNFHDVIPLRGRYGASYGTLLRRDADGGFEVVPLSESKLILDGQIRNLDIIEMAGGRSVVAALNDDTLQMIRPLNDASETLAERYAPE